jgi:predicted transcriptional regulator
MAEKVTRRLSVYIPLSKRHLKPIERIKKLARKRKCSINDLVVEAIIEYIKREERKRARKTATRKKASR